MKAIDSLEVLFQCTLSPKFRSYLDAQLPALLAAVNDAALSGSLPKHLLDLTIACRKI